MPAPRLIAVAVACTVKGSLHRYVKAGLLGENVAVPVEELAQVGCVAVMEAALKLVGRATCTVSLPVPHAFTALVSTRSTPPLAISPGVGE